MKRTYATECFLTISPSSSDHEKAELESGADVKTPHAKIGKLTLLGLLVQERFKVGRLYAVTLKRLTGIRASHRVSPPRNRALTPWVNSGFLLDMGPERL